MGRSSGFERKAPPWPPARRLAAVLAGAAAGVLVITAAALALRVYDSRKEGSPEAHAGGDPSEVERGGAHPVDGDSLLLADVLSVTDAVPWGDQWVILDGRSSRWHRVDVTGRRVLSAGGRGRGPGEMDRPAAVAVVGDTVLVAERTLGTLESFLVDGTPLGRRRIVGGGCVAGWVRRMVVVDDVLYLLRECMDGGTGGSGLRVDRLDPAADGETVVGTPVASRGRLDPGGTVPLRPGRPVLAGGEGLLLFGDARDGCLEVIVGAAGGKQEVCHPDPPRVPLPEDERAAALSAQRTLAGLGVRVEAPPYRVPFDEAFVLPGARVVFRTVLHGDRRRLDRVGPDGSHEVVLADATPLSHVGSNSILLAGEALDGTWVRVLPLR